MEWNNCQLAVFNFVWLKNTLLINYNAVTVLSLKDRRLLWTSTENFKVEIHQNLQEIRDKSKEFQIFLSPVE